MCECGHCVETGPDQWPAERIRLLCAFAQLVTPATSSYLTQQDYRRLGFYRRLAQTGKIGEEVGAS